GVDTGQEEEEVEEIKKTVKEKLQDFDPKKAVAGYNTYFRTDTPKLYMALQQNITTFFFYY
ncbi:12696_t:CDS:1, partial [Gigaspora rosea]